MRRCLVFILSIILSPVVNSQEILYKKTNKNYSWRTATKSQIDSFYYGLEPINSSKKKIHLRISLTGQLIDLFSTDGVNYMGVLTNVITEYGSEKVKGQDYESNVARQEVFQKIDLDKIKVKYVIDSLNSSKLLNFPTDSLIPNWNNNFLHCSYIHIQQKINQKFKSQEYYCPWSQDDSLSFKSIIVDNHQLLKKVFHLDSLYSSFQNKLPKGKTYSRDGYRLMYKLTDKESAGWNQDKPRRDYLKGIKDTVDNYLKSRLDNLDIELVEIDCFEDYRLVFGKNGKIKKIRVSKYDKPKLKNSLGLKHFLEEKSEVRKCKRKIREVFDEMDLSFLSLKHEIHRTFSFDHKKQFHLTDDTIY
ncbi:hypothetical protein GTQ34_16285 [Muricauda sp. JGD-17]|uniref:Uncharacterized protein n=1 Tax=Flagellimonas ochracea TaxID=2696472 RepID=A0A964TFH5_9FLAO|nr:hypothetical protein [Allomuricauda ochracea]NAY93471.1 hypothetical protein [Allomuricauda ochracea]